MATSVSMAIISLLLINLKANNPRFGTREDMGKIEHHRLSEASGLAASKKNRNILWIHNDSGKRARVFAMDRHARHLASYQLPGVKMRDWEDIAVGPGPDSSESYIYIGDIGDNGAIHGIKYIYRIPEPKVAHDVQKHPIQLHEFDRIAFRYPDGKRDAEALLVDAGTRDIYVVSKREDRARVYQLRYPQSLTEVTTAEHVASLEISGVVAGDISGAGTELLLKTYNKIYYWKRKSGEIWADALQSEPVVLPYILELQGEAVCWDLLAVGYFTTSEEFAGFPAQLYYYPRVNTEAAAGH